MFVKHYYLACLISSTPYNYYSFISFSLLRIPKNDLYFGKKLVTFNLFIFCNKGILLSTPNIPPPEKIWLPSSYRFIEILKFVRVWKKMLKLPMTAKRIMLNYIAFINILFQFTSDYQELNFCHIFFYIWPNEKYSWLSTFL